ncbi:MAG: Lrp/AsnC family transcriptional regulator [Thermodesulfobacteriota bacterium]
MIILDELDRKIVIELQENGRRSYKEIAKKLKVSNGTVRLRTEKMIEKGLVKIKALTNPFKFEHRICALVGINLERRGHAEKMKQVSKLKGVTSVMNCTGRYDLFVEVFLDSQKELMEFLVNEISKVDGIQATETFVYLDGINKWVTFM